MHNGQGDVDVDMRSNICNIAQKFTCKKGEFIISAVNLHLDDDGDLVRLGHCKTLHGLCETMVKSKIRTICALPLLTNAIFIYLKALHPWYACVYFSF